MGRIGLMDLYSPGPLPVIAQMAREIRLVETINQVVDYDETQCHLSPGERVLAMVMNLLTDRQALYRMPEFFKGTDIENLFDAWRDDDEIEPADVNDDTLGRGLDKIHDAGGLAVASSVIVEALNREDVSMEVLHGDTTSISVEGDYDGTDDENLDITYGHSKDHRPDLKQFKVGLGVNQDGAVCLGDILDGNESDKAWNQDFIQRLMDVYGDEDPLPVYVVDSAGVTRQTLNRLKTNDMELISRMPHTYDRPEELIERAWESGDWHEIGTLSDRDEAAEYRLQSFEETLYGESYRFVVVHSSTLDGRKERAIDNELERTEKNLQSALDDLESRAFACEADAREALDQFRQQTLEETFELKAHIEEDTRRETRDGPGRPPADWEPEYETVYRVSGTLQRDDDVIKERKEKASCFVLITSLKESEQWSHQRVLETYKDQSSVERSFAFIKDPKTIGPMYLDSPERVEALGYVLLMALLVYSLIERRVRQALQSEQEPMNLAGGKSSHRPTGRRVLERFENMMVAREGTDRSLPDNLEIPWRVLDLLGMDETIYGVNNS
ncbi:MAG: IS1634 family transposase [Halobacteriaceae archaeon]